MTPDMKQAGGGKMDRFFDEYVYGTALPTYRFDHSFEAGAQGDYILTLKLTQENVDDHFRMLVPVYLELADGRTVRLGRLPITGNNSIEQKVPLQGLKEKPRRAVINYMADVLATN
jgi:hypothetical protein